MKKLIVVFLLSTTLSAQTRPWSASHCGKHQIANLPAKYFQGSNCYNFTVCDGEEHFFDMKKDPKFRHPLPNHWFYYNKDGDLFYKGLKCQDFTDADY